MEGCEVEKRKEKMRPEERLEVTGGKNTWQVVGTHACAAQSFPRRKRRIKAKTKTEQPPVDGG